MDKKKEELINAFVSNPTTYTIGVRINDMLPDKLKSKKEIAFTIKPPTMHVLSLCAALLSDIPEEIYKSDEIELSVAMEYQENISKVISILSWEGSDYPDWYTDFIIKNVPSINLLQIMQETALKCNPGFFLNSIQIAKASNPMMLNDLTLTDS